MAFGNATGQGFVNPEEIITQIVIIEGDQGHLLVYSGTPALGNLIASIAGYEAEDSFGNTYYAGIGSYGNFDPQIVIALMLDGTMQFGIADQIQGVDNAAPGIIGLGSVNVPYDSLVITGPLLSTLTESIQLILTAVAAGDVPLLSVADGGLQLQSNVPNPPTPANPASTILVSHNGQLQHVSGADTNTYNDGHLAHWLTSNTSTIDSLTPAPLPGLSYEMVSGEAYLVRGTVIVNQGTVAAQQGVQFGGTATASLVAIRYESKEGTTLYNTGVLTALGTNMSTGAIPASTTGELSFEGVVTCNGSGTFTVEVDCITSAADTWVAAKGSICIIEPAN
jgi:hypothetical protein